MNWASMEHCYDTGTLVGRLRADGHDVTPVRDEDDNYTEVLLLTVNGRSYDLKVTPHNSTLAEVRACKVRGPRGTHCDYVEGHVLPHTGRAHGGVKLEWTN